MRKYPYHTKTRPNLESGRIREISKSIYEKINMLEVERSLCHLLIELVPGFIHDLNNMMGILENFRDMHNNSYSSTRNLHKIFDTVLGAADNTKNFFSVLRRNTDTIPVVFCEYIHRLSNLFKYKFIEKKIHYDLDCTLPYYLLLPVQFTNYLFTSILFYLTELSSGEGNLSIVVKSSADTIELLFTRTILNPVLPVNSFNKISMYPNLPVSPVSKHIEFCNTCLQRINLAPIEIFTEKNDITSQRYLLKLQLPFNFFYEIHESDVPEELPAAVPAKKSKKKKTDQPSILIIDDEKMMCNLLMSIFDNDSYKLAYALEPNLGVQKFKKEPFDVVICDYMLPGTTAKEVVKQLTELSHDTKIIIITGCEEQSIEYDLLNPPVYAVLRKPFKIDDIITTVNKLLQ